MNTQYEPCEETPFFSDSYHVHPNRSDFACYLDQLGHIEKLLYRHLIFIAIGGMLVAGSIIGALLIAHKGINSLSLIFLGASSILSIFCLTVPHSRAKHYHLKALLLLERLRPPGSPSPLNRQEVISNMEDSHLFINTIDAWIYEERSRVMLALHQIGINERYPLISEKNTPSAF